MHEGITLHRNDLYKEVWLKPISRLAPKYGISDVGLKKICKKLNVPVPPRGYWAKVKYGIRAKKAKLPKLKSDAMEEYTIRCHSRVPDDNLSKSFFFSPEAEELLQTELKNYHPISVPEQLTSSLPIVRQTRKELRKQKANEYGVVRSGGDEHLNIRVSPSQISRALRIMNALLKGLKQRGFLVSDNRVKILGEKIRIILDEKVKRTDHILTEKEKKKKEQGRYFYAPKWDFNPTGILTLRIDEYWAHGKRKSWRDTSKQNLENLLNDFILGAIKIADSLKKERLEREEQHRIWEEERRLHAEAELQRQMELERRQRLENQAVLWNKSLQIRNYIDAVEKATSGKPEMMKYEDQIRTWIVWARQHADRLDPLHENLPFLNSTEDGDSFRD